MTAHRDTARDAMATSPERETMRITTETTRTLDQDLDARLTGDGFAFVPADRARAMIAAAGPLDDWNAFAASWADLEQDTYMADGGRYRRRRHGVFRCDRDGTLARQPHQPHWQGLDYNPLNGGIERWFAPIRDDVARGQSLATILGFCGRHFTSLSPEVASWHVEVHQFRIEARPGEAGQPTPEGMHRDGVDWVLVLLVQRTNIASGTTTIAGLDKLPLGSFTLTAPCDAALVDDRRVYHGVTPVVPIEAGAPAFRDVLVVTFRRT